MYLMYLLVLNYWLKIEIFKKIKIMKMFFFETKSFYFFLLLSRFIELR